MKNKVFKKNKIPYTTIANNLYFLIIRTNTIFLYLLILGLATNLACMQWSLAENSPIATQGNVSFLNTVRGEFKAGNYIELLPTFHAQPLSGGVFEAKIEPVCNTLTQPNNAKLAQQQDNYTPFLSSANRWYLIRTLLDTTNGIAFETNGDTTINGMVYTKIYGDCMNFGLELDQIPLNCDEYVFVREDTSTRRIYRLSHSSNQQLTETILYDFNLNIGDIMPPNGGGLDFHVTSIDSIFNNALGTWLTRYTFTSPDAMFTATWVEGLGNIAHPFIKNQRNVGGSNPLICTFKNDVTVYHNDPGIGNIQSCNYFDDYRAELPPTQNTLLPITLAEFNGRTLPTTNLLQWRTTTEINNDFFTLLHSSDGANFQPIAKITGAGSSNRTLDYEFAHQQPANSAYYQLTQTDYDGKTTIVGNLHLLRDNVPNRQLTLSPNPATSQINVHWNDDSGSQTDTYQVSILDVTGKQMAIYDNLTYNSLNVDVKNYPAGIYILTVKTTHGKFIAAAKVAKE